MSLRIFLSHAWRDKSLAAFKEIESELRSSHTVWVDKREIEFGEPITGKLDEAVNSSDLVLVLWSKNAHESEDVMHEIETASRLGKPVIACKITDYEPDEHPLLRGRKFLHFERQLAAGLAHLKQFLVRTQNRDNALYQADKGLQAKITALNDMLSEIEDWEYRKEMGHTGNEASSAYANQMLEMGKALLAESSSMPAEEKLRMASFFQKLQEIARTYPDPSQEALKKKLLVQAIDEVDPEAKSERLQMFKMIVSALEGT